MISKTITIPHLGKLQIVAVDALGSVSEEQITALFSDFELQALRLLGGRGGVIHRQLEGVGEVVLKHYLRGGVFGRLIRSHYICWGKTRSQAEFEMLQWLATQGIRVPEPLAYVSEGALWYQAWLLMREIPKHQTVAELSQLDDARLCALFPRVIAQCQRLIALNVFHVDLHPGNVVIDAHDEVYLLDFDKAVRFRGDRKALRDHYLCRWRRAVMKHDLPEFLSELFAAGLLKNSAEEVMR
jgi:Lipopolysaccharide kinase (Kdo/WaaP) family